MYKIAKLEDIERYTDKIYKEGYTKGLSTGIPALDPHYKYRKGELDVIMGIANIGKTTMMFYLMMNASMRYNWKWLCYCPENEPVGDMITELAEMYVGRTADKDKPERMSSSIFKKAISWVLEHFVIVTFAEAPTMGQVLTSFEELLTEGDYDGCLVDPVNDLRTEKGMSKYEYYYSMLSDVRRFKQKHNVKFILTTHAGTAAARKKDAETGRTVAPSMYDVEYGGMYANRSDNFLVIHRHTGDVDWDNTEIHVRKIKFQKLVGVPTQDDRPVILKYKPDLCRFTSIEGRGSDMRFVDPLEKLGDKFSDVDEFEFDF
tara:strand:- start:10651 stop:11601 length:951 start_codon:yes stop_codon:yes gene_type:complete